MPLVVLEQTGMRLGELEGLSWGDVDEGRSRRRVSAGLTSRCVTSLALSGRTLQIGTGGGGVFTKQISLTYASNRKVLLFLGNSIPAGGMHKH